MPSFQTSFEEILLSPLLERYPRQGMEDGVGNQNVRCTVRTIEDSFLGRPNLPNVVGIGGIYFEYNRIPCSCVGTVKLLGIILTISGKAPN